VNNPRFFLLMVQPNFAASWLSLRDTIRCYGLLSRSTPQKMWSAKAKKNASAALLALSLITVLLVRHVSRPIDASARGQFLRFVPADTTSVAFIDFDELRSSPFLASLFAWAPHPTEDSEYAQFVRDTGFHYERDLDSAYFAFANHGTTSTTLALAEGNFDRARIETFLDRSATLVERGGLKIYVLPGEANHKPLSVALLSRRRIAITNSENLFAVLSDAVRQPDHAEWQARFDRLAGSPAFAVIRQDPALKTALGSAAPGGFRSPELAALLAQLQWISIAGKPDHDLLRLVAEGEGPSDSSSSQLRDFLQGVQLLAQNGLNDPKLRQQMDPQERQAYLELLKSVEIQKLDRGESKSVRLVLSVTPHFFAVANMSSLLPKSQASEPPDIPEKQSVPHKTKSAKGK
jgi:hypothetical protein